MTAFIRSAVISGLILASGSMALAQGAAPQGAGQQPQVVADIKAEQVRDAFMQVLEKYPPALGQVLKLDQSLILKDDYLAPYPAVRIFLSQHPEVRQNPTYYLQPVPIRLNSPYSGGGYYEDPRSRAWENMMEWFAVVMITSALVGGLLWLIRTAMHHRRWGRQAKVQAEAHTKLLDRLTSNDELLAYVQSAAGTRFLQSAPIAVDGEPAVVGAPISRILWSMQAGVVGAAAGLGLNYVSRRVNPEMTDPIFMMSVLLLSVGIGFFVSAAMSYVLSKRLGLISTDQSARA